MVSQSGGHRRRVRAPGRRPLALVVAVALLCFGAAILEESFTHTDDGCVVEVHCLACRLAAATTAVVEAAGVPMVAGVPSEAVVPLTVVLIALERPVLKPSRAPPLA